MSAYAHRSHEPLHQEDYSLLNVFGIAIETNLALTPVLLEYLGDQGVYRWAEHWAPDQRKLNDLVSDLSSFVGAFSDGAPAPAAACCARPSR